MAGNRTEPPQPGQSSPARRQQEADPGPEQQRGERCGPLAITRQRKDDGRALILYAASGAGARE
jgi:hypothetical protein